MRARHCGPRLPELSCSCCRRQKMPRRAARMFSWEFSPARFPDADGDRLCSGSRHANDASVSLVNESSCLSFKFTLLLTGRSAPIDAPSWARRPGKVRRSELEALCDAIGNSALPRRKRAEPRDAAVRERSREDAQCGIIISRNVNRYGNSTSGSSKDSDISAGGLSCAAKAIASGSSTGRARQDVDLNGRSNHHAASRGVT